MSFTQKNTLVGWGVFIFGLLVYLLTAAPTVSFWDSGEFIACANELEVSHPPGAPLYLLLGRLFAIFSFGNPSLVAPLITGISVLSGAFMAMFVCWTTILLIRKVQHRQQETWPDNLTLAAGIVAGLCCIFADSIWFNAVEAEVYALSSFFTTLVVWLMFKWDAHADEPGSLRYLVLIAYLIGLSLGVHLLNLLSLPVIFLLYYLKKYPFSWKGVLASLLFGGIALLFIQYFVLQYSFWFAWKFEQLFTGTIQLDGTQTGWGLPVGTGSFVFLLLFLGGLGGLIYWSHQRQKALINSLAMITLIILIGFSSFLVVWVRSAADPSIDSNNPENVLTFLSYMRRDQYAKEPLVRGRLYHTAPDQNTLGRLKTQKGPMRYLLPQEEDRYRASGAREQFAFPEGSSVWFPRMHNPEYYRAGTFGYQNFVKDKGSDPQNQFDDNPSGIDELRFFFKYQLNHMYWRYFLWNFVGKAHDIQDADWESGLMFWKNKELYGDKKDNRGQNHYFYLPFLLGLFGLLWHLKNHPKDFSVVLLLFFYTGIGVIIYLNQTPGQVRERDYAYVGSFHTFCMWIGMGIIWLYAQFKKFGPKTAFIASITLGLLPALLMGYQNWDDHSRKGRFIDREFALNILNACDQDAILFTGGDNDTHPIWYLQEVEGVRTDVRVVNLDLLQKDWYIESLSKSINGAKAVPISLKKEKYMGESFEFLPVNQNPRFKLISHKDSLLARGIIDPNEFAQTYDTLSFMYNTGQDKRLYRNERIMLHIMSNVALDGWKRPVYFNSAIADDRYFGLQNMFRFEGLLHRLLPLQRTEKTVNDIYFGRIDVNRAHRQLTQTFVYTGLDNPDVNHDGYIRNLLIRNIYQKSFFRLARVYGDEILRVQKEIQNNGDSTQLPGLRRQLEIVQNRLRELAIFEKKVIPYETCLPDLTYLAARTELYEVIGENSLAEIEFPYLWARCAQEMVARRRRGERIPPDDMALLSGLFYVRHLAYDGNFEAATEAAEFIRSVSGYDKGLKQIEEIRTSGKSSAN